MKYFIECVRQFDKPTEIIIIERPPTGNYEAAAYNSFKQLCSNGECMECTLFVNTAHYKQPVCSWWFDKNVIYFFHYLSACADFMALMPIIPQEYLRQRNKLFSSKRRKSNESHL